MNDRVDTLNEPKQFSWADVGMVALLFAIYLATEYWWVLLFGSLIIVAWRT